MSRDSRSDLIANDGGKTFLFEHMLSGVAYCEMIVDEEGLPDWVYLDVNPAFNRLTGLSDVVGKRVTEAIPGIRESNPELFEVYGRIARTGVPEGFDAHLEPLGLWLHVHANSPSPGYFIAIFDDISERKNSEQTLERTARRLEAVNEQLGRMARALRLLSLTDKALVGATDERQLLQDICDLIVHTGQHSMAWVGYASRNASRPADVVAQTGDSGYLASIGDVDSSAGIAGRMPMEVCIREGRTVAIRNLKTWKTRARWKKRALDLGYRASLDLPLLVDGKVIGALELWASEIGAFDPEETSLIEELAASLGSGISNLRAHEVQASASQSLGLASLRLEQMLMDVTEAIGRVVELRDPYTQGHQERVAGLAKLIASELGLRGEDVVAIEITGLVHDIGKMKVPIEILANPNRLDEMQLAIVQEHPRSGYEILKNVAFPWPVAETVLQHHERLDGSGYPGGLVGDAISLPARILAVADVVEALSSHRPHRPAVSLDVAIAQVRDAEGKFDPEVVAACMRLHKAGRIAF